MMKNIKEEIEFEMEDCKKELKVANESLQALLKNENYGNIPYYGNRIAEFSAKLAELEYIYRKLD